MDIASLISFGILVVAWLTLPVKRSEESEPIMAAAERLLTSGQTA